VARAVDYVNAGTVEFLVDAEKNFYFLEMNTRLQVEHPVTELVTAWIWSRNRSASRAGGGWPSGWRDGYRLGGRMPHQREDPLQQFPALGGAGDGAYRPTGPGIRLDSGIYAGYQVTPYYDSMLAKLIAYGETRGEAILRMRRALNEYKIMG